MNAQLKRAPWVWPLLLIAGGVVLLLDNFLLIDLDLTPYWPILFVLLGLQVLLRGDIAPSWQAHTFGITRGSVESASVEIQSGELDVQLHPLRKPGRLIAGQYTARSRPSLVVRNNHASLRMQRGETWWLSMADWELGLANDLPWGMLVSSYLGHLELDLAGMTIDRVYAASGMGRVDVICPRRAWGTVYARSTLGDVSLTIQPTSRALVTVQAGPFARLDLDETRFEELEPGVYATTPYDPDAIDLYLTASTVFGTIHID
jgi:hypothetical protein